MAERGSDNKFMVVRDIELEMMNPKRARKYFGKKLLPKTPFRPESLPLLSIKSNHSKES